MQEANFARAGALPTELRAGVTSWFANAMRSTAQAVVETVRAAPAAHHASFRVVRHL